MNLNKAILGLLLSTFSLTGSAQEMLMDLGSNALLRHWDEVERAYQNSDRAPGDTLDLPFFDDFSEPFSRLRTNADLYPNQDRWIGKTVYQNNHMAVNPISQGVLTFDGLNEFGLPYGFGFSLPFLADSLLSKPLRLQGAADSVILSFYFQAQGLGNDPNEDDLLILEFKDTAENWTRVWEAEGYVLEDFKFNRVAIPVVGEEYLFNGFQFRFLNYASRAGNVDHWHIDYVELDQARSLADSIIRDVSLMSQSSFLGPPDSVFQQNMSSLLNDFSAMPWDHYKFGDGDILRDSALFVLRNNFNENYSPNFSMQVLNSQGTQVSNVLSSTAQVYPWVICGNQLNTCNPGTSTNFNFNIVGVLDSLPTDVEITPDSMYFEMKYTLGVVDDVPTNDVLVEKLEFYNYYAYDDGTAEAAYGLGELEDVGMVAVKYNLKKPDILRSIQLYLNPVEFDLSQVPVKLAVWYGNNQPEDTLWTSPEFINLNYTSEINYFYHYFLERELPVSDNIWVGWIQQPATNLKFSIGFDKRVDRSQNVFYNLGTTWNQSSISGSVMIRPTIGQAYDWVGVNEAPKPSQLAVYPNPSSGIFQLQTARAVQFSNANIQVFDLSGRMVFGTLGYSDHLDLSQLHSGTYVLKVDTRNEVLTQRIIIQQ